MSLPLRHSSDLYFDGPAGSSQMTSRVLANLYRADLCSPLGSCSHGFSMEVPESLCDGQWHSVYAYGVDANDGRLSHLNGSPRASFATWHEVPSMRREVRPSVVGPRIWMRQMYQIRSSSTLTARPVRARNSSGSRRIHPRGSLFGDQQLHSWILGAAALSVLRWSAAHRVCLWRRHRVRQHQAAERQSEKLHLSLTCFREVW